ncbi:hypothetical protein CsSME_00029420 [Camellia sinensis var. sinensis]
MGIFTNPSLSLSRLTPGGRSQMTFLLEIALESIGPTIFRENNFAVRGLNTDSLLVLPRCSWIFTDHSKMEGKLCLVAKKMDGI